jgi:hypothetical protein
MSGLILRMNAIQFKLLMRRIDLRHKETILHHKIHLLSREDLLALIKMRLESRVSF